MSFEHMKISEMAQLSPPFPAGARIPVLDPTEAEAAAQNKSIDPADLSSGGGGGGGGKLEDVVIDENTPMPFTVADGKRYLVKMDNATSNFTYELPNPAPDGMYCEIVLTHPYNYITTAPYYLLMDRNGNTLGSYGTNDNLFGLCIQGEGVALSYQGGNDFFVDDRRRSDAMVVSPSVRSNMIFNIPSGRCNAAKIIGNFETDQGSGTEYWFMYLNGINSGYHSQYIYNFDGRLTWNGGEQNSPRVAVADPDAPVTVTINVAISKNGIPHFIGQTGVQSSVVGDNVSIGLYSVSCDTPINFIEQLKIDGGTNSFSANDYMHVHLHNLQA